MERYPGTAPTETGSNTQGGQATEQARQQTHQLARQARQRAGQLANRGSEQVKSQLDNQKHQASQRMVPVQTALRETAHQLRGQGQGPIAQYADRASDQVERFSGYLRETDADQIIDEVRGVARRRPALFLGAAAALGFFATRFLKSSSQEQDASAADGPSTTPTAISGATVTHGTREPPGTALPPRAVEGDLPTAGQPLSEGERTEPPRGS